MKNLTNILVSIVAVGALASCGDDNKAVDAAVPIDTPDIDAGIPAVPTLGAPIDRMGRPAVNTALVAPIGDDPLKTAKKDAYNHAIDPATWVTTVLDAAATPPTTVRGEFSVSSGLFDSLDQGAFAGPTPPSTIGPGGGCGNAALYSASTGYATLATVLADDQLYVDTTKLTCLFYLSLEVEVATAAGVPHTQCGGRTLTNDVIDTSYSLLSAGLSGFAPGTFAPLVGDGVAAHTDVDNATFPFLGAPH